MPQRTPEKKARGSPNIFLILVIVALIWYIVAHNQGSARPVVTGSGLVAPAIVQSGRSTDGVVPASSLIRSDPGDDNTARSSGYDEDDNGDNTALWTQARGSTSQLDDGRYDDEPVFDDSRYDDEDVYDDPGYDDPGMDEEDRGYEDMGGE